jgi:hypothetical protein
MSRFALVETFWRRGVDTDLVSFARNYKVFVYGRGTEDLATLWSAEEGGVEVEQPLLTDSGGRARGEGDVLAWAEYALYEIEVNGVRIPWPPFLVDGGEGAGVSEEELDAAIAAHSVDTTGVHGVADTAQLATKSEVAAKQDAATAATDAELSGHEADTTAVHGIADTSKLATKAEVEAKQDASTAATDAELSAHEADTTNVHGITDTSKIATKSEVEPKASKTELETHTGKSSGAHAASAISYAGNAGMSATDIEGAIDELAGEVDIETFTFNHSAPAAAVVGGFFIRVPTGFTRKLLGIRISTVSGSCKVKLKRTTSAGATTEPLKEKEAKTEATEHAPSSETLADKDRLLLEVESVSSPTFLIVSVMIETVRS